MVRLTFEREDLVANVLPWLGQGQIDVVLPPWHESIDDDNRLVHFLVDPDKHALPGDLVHVHPQAVCEFLVD